MIARRLLQKSGMKNVANNFNLRKKRSPTWLKDIGNAVKRFGKKSKGNDCEGKCEGKCGGSWDYTYDKTTKTWLIKCVNI